LGFEAKKNKKLEKGNGIDTNALGESIVKKLKQFTIQKFQRDTFTNSTFMT
jgi:hypothetical protein